MYHACLPGMTTILLEIFRPKGDAHVIGEQSSSSIMKPSSQMDTAFKLNKNNTECKGKNNVRNKQSIDI